MGNLASMVVKGKPVCLLTLVCCLNAQTVCAATSEFDQLLADGKRQVYSQDLSAAESTYRRALRSVRSDKVFSADDVALAMQKLAEVLQAELYKEEAESLYKKALSLLEKKHGSSSLQLVPTLLVLGKFFEVEGDYVTARKYYERACTIAKKGPAAQRLELAHCYHRLGRVEYRLGFYREAETLYNKSLTEIMACTELRSTVLLQDLLSDYMQVYYKSPSRGRLLSSDFQAELLKDRIDALQRTSGVEPSAWSKAVSARLSGEGSAGINSNVTVEPSVGSSLNAAVQPPGLSQSDSSRLPSDTGSSVPPSAVMLDNINSQRVAFYERMIAVDIDSLGPDHPSVARDLGGLAAVYLGQKKFDKAKPLLQRALQIYRDQYGADAMLVQQTQSLLDLIAQDQEKPVLQSDEVLDSYRASLPLISVGAQKLEIALKLNDVAFAAYCHGRISEAEQIYKWALAATSGATGTQSTLSACCLNDYATVLRSSGKSAEAQALSSTAQAILRKAAAARVTVQ